MNKVLCPYCGREMELETDSLFDVGSCGEDDFYYYECPDCAAHSPCAGTNEQAYANAMRRPLQRPLTLEEAKEQVSVWIEYSEKVKFVKRAEPALYVCSDDSKSCFDEGFSEQFRLANKDYGEMWRCWATKPSDEEREAAKWE